MPSVKRPSLRARWCFTLNNYTPSELQNLKEFSTNPCVRYIIVGKETGDNGTPHLQGYLELEKQWRITAFKKIEWSKRAHFEIARGTFEHNTDYCSKENTFIKEGKPYIHKEEQKTKRKKTVGNLIEMRLQGITDYAMSVGDYANLYAVHKRHIEEIVKAKQQSLTNLKLMDLFNNITWHAWQQQLINIVTTIADNRTIHWYFDTIGNTGKTFLSRYMQTHHKAIVFNNSKTADIAHAYNSEPIVIFDLARSLCDHVNYCVIEQLKNGYVFSSKYNSHGKLFPVPHVIVFANFLPQQTKLSADRWHLVDIQASLITI